MINETTAEIRILPDKWTVVEANGNYSAHFEHTIAITNGEPLRGIYLPDIRFEEITKINIVEKLKETTFLSVSYTHLDVYKRQPMGI